MSIQDAKNFLNAVDQDPRLQEQVRGSFDQVVEMARQNGYEISAKDLAEELCLRWEVTRQPNYDDNDTCTFCGGKP